MEQKALIYEVYKGNSFEGLNLNESQVGVPEGMMRVTGVAAVIGVKNRNNRIYNKENYLEHIRLLQDDIAYGLFGELEHPESFTINLNNISHKVEKVWYEPTTNRVMATLLLLDTPKGKIAQSIIRSGSPLRISSRAMGNVNKNNEAMITKLVTYDIVGTPGFRETDLRLSESIPNATLISDSSLCESFYIPQEETDLNECLKVRYDGDISQLVNNHLINESMKNNNLALLESQLSRVGTTPDLSKISNVTSKWMADVVAPIFENWAVSYLIPLYEQYRTRKAINESMGKTACSFKAFYAMNAAEAARLNEAYQPLNGTIVLSEEEQQVVDKVAQGQQLTQEEQEIAQQAQQKLQQQQQKIQEALAPQNGTIVLTQQEQECLDKLQQGQQLTQEELQQAQQAIAKQQQQMTQQQQQMQEGQQQLLTQEEQYVVQKCMQGQQLTQRQQQIYQQAQQKLQQQQQKLQQQQQQKRQQQKPAQQMSQQEQEQKKQELTESYNNIQNKLTESYRLLIESEDQQEQEKINQQIDDLKQQCQDVQQQLDELTEAQEGSQQFKDCQKKIQQGQQLTQDDLDGLTEDELQQLIQQQKQCSEATSDYDDPNDAKVFEQCQLTQQEQEVVKKQQKGEQLSQEEEQILKQAQEKIQQQQLPEDDKKVNESLVSRYGADVLGRSGSLLESLQKRMGLALDGKN